MSDRCLEVGRSARGEGEDREERRLESLEDMLRLGKGRSHGVAYTSNGTTVIMSLSATTALVIKKAGRQRRGGALAFAGESGERTWQRLVELVRPVDASRPGQGRSASAIFFGTRCTRLLVISRIHCEGLVLRRKDHYRGQRQFYVYFKSAFQPAMQCDP